MIKLSKKAGSSLFGTLGAVIIALLFLVFIIMIFFGEDGKLGVIADKIGEVFRRLFTGVEDADQSELEMSFARTNAAQLKFFTNWSSSISTALKCDAPKGGCIMTLASLETDGFYNDDANYNLYIEQGDEENGENIVIRLTRYAKQTTESDAAKVETPVTRALIEGAQLCIIQGESAENFYKEFNDINKEKGEIPDLSKIKPVPVDTIKISSGKTGDTEREIGYSVSGPITENDYKWNTFFKKDSSKTTIYAVRIDNGGTKYVCFFPLSSDIGFGSGCSGIKNGLLDSDCVDSDGESKSLKYNFDNNLISADYVCSITAKADTQITAKVDTTTKTTT